MVTKVNNSNRINNETDVAYIIANISDANVINWINNVGGGCSFTETIMANGMTTSESKDVLANFTVDIGGGTIIDINEITDNLYTNANIIVALDDWDRDLLWDNAHAGNTGTNLVTRAKTTFSNFVEEAVKAFPSYVASIQEENRGDNSMEAYFNHAATYYSQSLQDSLLDTFAVLSDRFEDIYALDEWHIYGLGRLGTKKMDSLRLVVISFRGTYDADSGTYKPLIVNGDTIIATTTFTLNDSMYTCERGQKRYELSNHLGNVLVVISDKKLHQCDTTQDTFIHYRAEVLAAQDYYPFGMLMPDRTWEIDTTYRYGFQRQEGDDEIRGNGNSVNYKYRMHDPRLGRFFAIDPLYKKYPWNSTYAFSENIVINAIELEGLEKVYFWTTRTEVNLKGMTEQQVKNVFEQNNAYWTSEWYDPDASESEYWVAGKLKNGNDHTYGRYLEKYALKSSYFTDYGYRKQGATPYFQDYIVGSGWEFIAWLEKDLTYRDGWGAGLKMTINLWGVILSGGALLEAEGIGLAIASFVFVLSADELTQTKEGGTVLETVIRDSFGEEYAELFNNFKIAVNIGMAAKGFTKLTITFATGERIEGVYDNVNNVFELAQGSEAIMEKIKENNNQNNE